MLRTIRIILLPVLFCWALGIPNDLLAQQQKLKGRAAEMLEKIHWLGHASFRIEGSKTVYIDPWKLSTAEAAKKADIILITHSHFDHFSPEDIAKIKTQETILFLPADVAKKMDGKVYTMKPGDKKELADITVEAVPAYNIGKQFHPRENHWMGYILTIDSVRIYHAGDTDFIPEMKELKNIDIALLPIGGTYTMTAQEAAEAVNSFVPKIAIPMHWGDIVGDESDVAIFKRMVKPPVRVEVLQAEH